MKNWTTWFNKSRGENTSDVEGTAPQNTGAPDSPADLQITVLDTEKPLSQSVLWKLHEDYYHNLGVAAWDQVPFYITSNAYIGNLYAEMAVAFLRDYRAHLDWEAPVYLVEMATGTGTFSYYMLTALLRKLQHLEDLKTLKIRYLMTDFTQSNLDYWATNPKLKALQEQGVLDFAVFVPEEQSEIVLPSSKEVISAQTTKNPVFAIANYFFDTIRHDLFRVDNHRLQEIRLTLTRECTAEEAKEPLQFKQIRTEASFVDIPGHYYDDPALNQILRFYAQHYEQASIVFPIGALNTLKNLRQMANNNLVLLSSDKGYSDLDYMQGHWVPGFAVHGSFSYMVNYDAIQRFFTLQGGVAYTAGENHHSLKTVMGIFRTPANLPLENVHYTFQEWVEPLNPTNNVYNVRDLAYPQDDTDPAATLRALIALLRLSHCDPVMFYYMGDRLRKALKSLPERDYYLELALMDVLGKARALFYPLRQSYNALYWMGSIYYNMDKYDHCLAVLQESLDVFGEDDRAVYLMACCHEVKGNDDQAHELYTWALKLDPECQFTRDGLARITQRRSEKASPPAKG